MILSNEYSYEYSTISSIEAKSYYRKEKTQRRQKRQQQQ